MPTDLSFVTTADLEKVREQYYEGCMWRSRTNRQHEADIYLIAQNIAARRAALTRGKTP